MGAPFEIEVLNTDVPDRVVMLHGVEQFKRLHRQHLRSNPRMVPWVSARVRVRVMWHRAGLGSKGVGGCACVCVTSVGELIVITTEKMIEREQSRVGMEGGRRAG